MKHIFLDANILFSASLPASRLRLLLKLLKKSEFTLVTNEYAIEEAARNLQVKAPERLAELSKLQKSVKISQVIDIHSLVSIKIAEKDLPILGGALGCRCAYLLTGDLRDFGRYMGKEIGTVRIVTPRMLAEELARTRLLKRKRSNK